MFSRKEYSKDELKEMSKKGIDKEIDEDIFVIKYELAKKAQKGYNGIFKEYNREPIPTKTRRLV